MPHDWDSGVSRAAHRPAHWLQVQGHYMVTCGTYEKEHRFFSRDRLTNFCDNLQALAIRYEWQLEAWAAFSNHYHFVAHCDQPETLPRFISHLHTVTATYVNKLDSTPGRKVWYQYWDTLLDTEKSLFSRMHYVLHNPVRHGLVANAKDYQWCSMRALLGSSDLQLLQIISSFDSSEVIVRDEFEPIKVG